MIFQRLSGQAIVPLLLYAIVVPSARVFKRWVWRNSFSSVKKLWVSAKTDIFARISGLLFPPCPIGRCTLWLWLFGLRTAWALIRRLLIFTNNIIYFHYTLRLSKCNLSEICVYSAFPVARTTRNIRWQYFTCVHWSHHSNRVPAVIQQSDGKLWNVFIHNI